MNTLFKVLLSGVLLGACAAGARTLLDMSDREDCARLERQVEGGYIKAVPAWCPTP